MPPKLPRVADVVGTPISPGVPITTEGPELALIAFAIVTMLFVGSLFLGGVWFFINRLNREQESTARIERRDSLDSGTGSKPDTPAPGRDFTPQADLNPRE